MTYIKKRIYFYQVCTALGEVIMIYLLKFIVDSMTQNKYKLFMFYIILTFVFVTINQLFRIFSIYKTEKEVAQISGDNRNMILKGVFSQQPEMYHSSDLGEYLASITNKIDRLENDVIRNKITIAYDVASFIFTMIAILSISYQFLLLYGVVGGIIILLPRIFQRKITQKQKVINDESDKLFSNLKNSFSGYDIVASTKTKKFIFKKIEKVIKAYEDSTYKYQSFSKGQQTILNSIGIYTQVLAFFVGGILIFNGRISIGGLVALTSFSNSTYGPIVWISQKLSMIKGFKPVLENLENLAEIKKEVKKENIDVIELKNINYTKNNNNILSNINLKFDKGRNYSIFGNSGSGKSVLAKIIHGDIISYDGEKMYKEKNIQLPNSIIITQETVIFEGTIKSNILLDRIVNEKKYNSILELLKINEFDKDNKKILNDDQTLSYGQRQRIGIARALVGSFDIIIFDEATNGLQENLVLDIIKYISKLDVIFINITHNKSYIYNENIEICIENGSIKEKDHEVF